MKKILISGVGCCLLDRIYDHIDFCAPTFRQYMSQRPGDGGLEPGKLTFEEEVERFAGCRFTDILPVLTQGRQPDKENIGGQTMLVLTAELSHAIWGPIRGAIFCDAGGSWASPYSIDFSKFNIGAGYGIRVKVPYLNVPIRLDIAYPFLNNQKGAASRVRLHFNVGAGFSI